MDMYAGLLILPKIIFWLVYSICLPDHKHYAHTSLLPTTEVSIRYHAKHGILLLFIPSILVVLIPLLLCPRLASIFSVVDSKIMLAVSCIHIYSHLPLWFILM